jgi:dUTP pyrophosphatase
MLLSILNIISSHRTMTSFMKEDEMLPKGLLNSRPPLPVEIHGLGHFGDYQVRTHVTVEAPELMPVRQTPAAAGFDLKSRYYVSIPASSSAIVDTGVSVALLPGHYARIAGRSSLAFNHDVTAFEGTIDEDYRGPIKVKLFNHSNKVFHIEESQRIAQMIIQTYVVPNLNAVSHLSQTQRGTGGFGSTGDK